MLFICSTIIQSYIIVDLVYNVKNNVTVQSKTEGTEIKIGKITAGKIFEQSKQLNNINNNTVQPEYAFYTLVGCKIAY